MDPPLVSEVLTLLRACLRKFGKEDLLETYSDYLKSEWFYSLSDLKAAIEDGSAWSDLKLPGRLKIEIKKEILSIYDRQRGPTWLRCFSTEENSYYYYNCLSGATQWEEPIGEEVVDELSYPFDNLVRVTSHNDLGGLPPPPTYNSLTAMNEIGNILPPAEASNPPDELPPLLSILSSGIFGEPALALHQQPCIITTPASPTQQTDPITPTIYYSPLAQSLETESSSHLPLAALVEDLDTNIQRGHEHYDALHDDSSSYSPSIEADAAVGGDHVARLMEMGFVEGDCVRALAMFGNNLQAAAAHLVSTVLPGN